VHAIDLAGHFPVLWERYYRCWLCLFFGWFDACFPGVPAEAGYWMSGDLAAQ